MEWPSVVLRWSCLLRVAHHQPRQYSFPLRNILIKPEKSFLWHRSIETFNNFSNARAKYPQKKQNELCMGTKLMKLMELVEC